MHTEQQSLAALSLEELWQLFPIILTPHQDYWINWYREEAELLQENLPDIKRINHIGSTAIKGIWAKPTIDILVEVSPKIRLSEFKSKIEKCGYICMAENNNRIDFNKGYNLQGYAERVFHLHLRYAGDNDEICFRDYLNTHPDTAREYEKLKLGLWKKYEHDRDGYTAAKSEFVQKYTEIAKKRKRNEDYSFQ